MKKLMAAVVILLLLIPAFPCQAAELFHTEYVQKSERSVIFYLDISSQSDVSAAVFELTYDSSVVRYVSVTASSSTSSVRDRELDGKVRIAFADSGAVRGNICRFTFKAIQNGTASFVLHTEQAVDAELKSLTSDDHTLTLSFGKDEVVVSSSSFGAASRSAGISSSANSGSSSRSGSKSSVKVEKADQSKSVKTSRTSSKADKDSSMEEEDDDWEWMSDDADVIDLRKSDPGKWILIGAGIPVLIGALVLIGVLIGKRSNGQAKTKEKPGDELSEPDRDSEITEDKEE